MFKMKSNEEIIYSLIILGLCLFGLIFSTFFIYYGTIDNLKSFDFVFTSNSINTIVFFYPLAILGIGWALLALSIIRFFKLFKNIIFLLKEKGLKETEVKRDEVSNRELVLEGISFLHNILRMLKFVLLTIAISWGLFIFINLFLIIIN